MMNVDMQGKAVLVTGGTSGIGAGIAKAFRDCGAAVVATGATPAEVERARNDSDLGAIDFRVLDVREENAIAACVGSFASLMYWSIARERYGVAAWNTIRRGLRG